MDYQPPSASEPSDEALAGRVAQRDVDAFARLYDRYAQTVFTFAAHLLSRGEAEEVVQEVFLRLWNKAEQFDPARGAFNAWFLSVARHHILDQLRSSSQKQRLLAAEGVDELLAEAPDPLADVEQAVWLHERGEVILRALQQLPDEQRRVLVLAYFGGLSHSAIAEYLGLPLGTVKKRIRLALQKLRALLKRDDVVAESSAGSKPGQAQ